VSLDIRLIVYRTESGLLLCYVNHHDNAYHWAERRRLETHPKTGAAQLVEIRETVREITIPKYVEVEQAAPAKAPLFCRHPQTSSCWATACRSNGWTMYAGPLKPRYWSWPIICRPRPRRHCSIWQPGAATG